MTRRKIDRFEVEPGVVLMSGRGASPERDRLRSEIHREISAAFAASEQTEAVAEQAPKQKG